MLEIEKQAVRKERKEQGALDGRYRTRVIKNKKKHKNKYACRNFRGEET